MSDSGTGRVMDGRLIIVLLVIVVSTVLYGVGLFSSPGATAVEPQSVFTLYGTVLGYLFGSHEKKNDQKVEVAKKELGHE